MTVNDIVDELRATRPRASDALRPQVLTIAAEPAPRTGRRSASVSRRVAGSRSSSPAAAALAVAAAVAIGVTRSGSHRSSVESAAPDVARSSADGDRPATSLAAPPTAGRRDDRQKGATRVRSAAAPSATAPHLTLQVDDTDALSAATQQALAIARDLGGYVVARALRDGRRGRRVADAARAVARRSRTR